MANFNVPENPEFTKEIRRLETTDPGHADLFNTLVEKLFENELFLRKLMESYNYASCSTAAATTAKAVSCTGFSLVTGAEITIKFEVTNTAANPTLNVNSTGAKPIYYRGKAISAGYLGAGRTYTFRYNGAQYDLVGDINTDNNTTYSNMTAATASAAGKAGLVPAPAAGKQLSFLRGDGTWVAPGTSLTATAAGVPLDQTAGKALNDKIQTINNSLNGLSFTVLTQAEYDALASKNAQTLYFIKEG